MLLPGEYQELAINAQELNGLKPIEDKVEEAKN